MTYSSDYGRGGPGGRGAWQDHRSGSVPSQRYPTDSPGAYEESYGSARGGGHDPRPPQADRSGTYGAFDSDPYGGSYGDSGAYGSQYGGSSSLSNYGNVGQSFAVGDDQGRPSFGHNRPGGHHASRGDVVGDRYQLIDLVGKGGNGSVWRATDTVLRREVALKEVFLPPDLPPGERVQLIDRSRREAQIAAGLSHPSVIRVFDVVEHGGLPWIVMELLQARSLADILTQDGPLPPRVAAKIGLALVGALQAAHEAGIIHRDVKPGNVLISTDGRCVLSDFGAAQMNQVSGGTTPGKVLGSAHYIAPERAVGHPAEPASDVFSLGVTLYAAVEGRPPFDRGDAVSTMRAVVQDPPESPRGAGPLTSLLAGMLTKEPAERHTLGRVRQELAGLLSGPLAGPGGGAPSGPPGQPSPPMRAPTGGHQEVGPPPRRRPPTRDEPKSHTGRNAAIVAAVLIVVLGAGYLLYEWRFAGDDTAQDPGPTSNQTTGEASPDDDGESATEATEPSFETTTHEGSGFSVNYPADWGVGLADQEFETFYNIEDETHWVRFYSGSDRGAADPEAYLSDYFGRLSSEMSDLEQVRLDGIEFGGMSGSVLEYTGVNSSDGAERHSIWALVDAGDGTSYSVFVSGPAGSWELSQEVFDEAVRSFRTG